MLDAAVTHVMKNVDGGEVYDIYKKPLAVTDAHKSFHSRDLIIIEESDDCSNKNDVNTRKFETYVKDWIERGATVICLSATPYFCPDSEVEINCVKFWWQFQVVRFNLNCAVDYP